MNLLNFSIDHHGTLVKIAGQTFDLHNHFTLHNYHYDVAQRTFTLTFKSTVFWDENATTNVITTDLSLVFDKVDLVRIDQDSREIVTLVRVDEPDDPNEPKVVQGKRDDYVLVSIKTVDQMVDEAYQHFSQFEREHNLPIQVGHLFSTDDDDIADWDWSNLVIISFMWGLSMLISAKTVSAFFVQRNKLEEEAT